MYILGIESSCDETALAIYHTKRGLIGHKLYSQIDLHQDYGGVVPELASRDHIKKMPLLLDALLKDCNMSLSELNGIAYTKGPGLKGALLVGATFAKTLAYSLDIPALGVNHLEAHLWAVMLEEIKPTAPFLMLLVSGGHTQLLAVNDLSDYQLLGETLDDACGEAFDKTAKLLGLPYPGGPALSAIADLGDMHAYTFSKPMVNRQGLDLSFSGLKTQVANTWNASDKTEQTKNNIAASFQKTICDTLIIKCQRALKQTGHKTLICAGGVGANKMLRARLKELMQKEQGECHFPRLEYCTDNGAMIAYLGAALIENGKQDQDLSIDVLARWPIDSKD